MDVNKIIKHEYMRYTYVYGYGRDYKIYADGEIWSAKSGKFLKQEISKGYKRVTLSQNGKTKKHQVHRLVAIHFIPNMLNKPCVNHIDGDKENNHLNNLEWNTYKENESHSYNSLGKINANRKLSKEAIEDIKSNASKGINQSNTGNIFIFSEKYNVSTSTILNVLKGKCYV